MIEDSAEQRGLRTLVGELGSRLTRSRPWQSVVRHGWPDNPLDRSLVVTSSLFLHLHPVKVSRRSLRWSYSFGLGVMAAILFGVLTFTGVLLMFYYVPSVERAYTTMKEIQFAVPLGQLTRNMHRWSAHAMVLIVALHMVRVFYTGGHKSPREFNWIIGVVLLLLTLGASFTGYLLPWDQLAFWAITVGTNIAGYAPVVGDATRALLLGGSTVGQDALIRFYTLHIAMLPIALVLLISFHVWRVRKDGGLAASDPDHVEENPHAQ
jgi:quinol-cytochrome oxidoreductase complex cytochrome b subunit